MDYSNAFVVLLGLGTVFFGLTCIILLTNLMSRLCRSKAKPAALPTDAPVSLQPARQEMIAAVSAALAEELGTDLSGIRILSFQKI